VIDGKVDKKLLASKILATGINAVPGAAVGKVVFSAPKAEQWAERGEKVILVRRETSPEDVGGMAVAQGILTATGGKTSHAAGGSAAWSARKSSTSTISRFPCPRMATWSKKGNGSPLMAAKELYTRKLYRWRFLNCPSLTRR
jgi:hypothetical protein